MSPSAVQFQANRLEKIVRASLDSGRFNCPECGHHGPHEDNGVSGDEKSFCCTVCGTHHEATEVARLIEEGVIGGGGL